MRKLCLLVLLVLCACAPAAQAATKSRFVIRGAGYGHGVGMSQYGAFGYALQGRDHRFILGRYYQGTSLGVLDGPRDVRVLLQGGRPSISFTGAVAAGDRPLDPGKTYSVTTKDGQLVLRSPTRRALGKSAPPLRIAAPGAGALVLRGSSVPGITDGQYRGAIEVRPGASGGVNAINALGLEDYVRGVVSAESPSAWPIEALKAQAVAARTYAITARAGSVSDGFDQYADVRSQVYRGVAAETARTDDAVNRTRGEVVTYGGAPVITYFFSTSGGQTENVENSFAGARPVPYLRGVADPYDDLSPKHRWGPLTSTLSQAGRRLGRLVQGRFKGIKVLQRGVSPRVVRAEVIGSRGRTAVTGPQLRKLFRLNDTWAFFTSVTAGVTEPPEAPAEDPAGPEAPAEDPAAADPGTGGVASDARAAAVRGRRAAVVGGTFQPGARGAWVRLQRREGAAWRTVAEDTLGRGGRYALPAPSRGIYRVVLGTIAGPSVRVR